MKVSICVCQGHPPSLRLGHAAPFLRSMVNAEDTFRLNCQGVPMILINISKKPGAAPALHWASGTCPLERLSHLSGPWGSKEWRSSILSLSGGSSMVAPTERVSITAWWDKHTPLYRHCLTWCINELQVQQNKLPVTKIEIEAPYTF